MTNRLRTAVITCVVVTVLTVTTTGCGRPKQAAGGTRARQSQTLVPFIRLASVSPDERYAVVVTVQKDITDRFSPWLSQYPPRTCWLLDFRTRRIEELPIFVSPVGVVEWQRRATRIAYNSDEAVATYDLATGKQRIAPSPGDSVCMWPSWSPDGRSLAYSVALSSEKQPDNAKGVIRVSSDLDTQPELVVTDDLSSPQAWCWTQDSDSIVYVPKVRPPGGGRSRTGARQLHPTWPGRTRKLSFSGDGSFLAVLTWEDGESPATVVVLDEALERVVATLTSRVESTKLIWSPTQPKLLLATESSAEGGFEACVFDVRDGRTTSLVQPGVESPWPVAWTVGPDGKEHLWFVAADGQALLRSGVPSAGLTHVAAIGRDGHLRWGE